MIILVITTIVKRCIFAAQDPLSPLFSSSHGLPLSIPPSQGFVLLSFGVEWVVVRFDRWIL
jgi:hypothetical protein